MQYGLFDFLRLIGALGFFIYGMKVMSEGIQKAAGSKLRNILKSMTSNRFIGVFTGFLITSIIQSSSATTVMTVSFVNAGLLTLIQSAGIIMGANIGTTITAWLVSLFGFKVKIVAICLPIIAFGFPMMFSKKLKFWGEFLIGFAFVFIGLEELKNAVPDIKQNPEILSFVASFADLGYLSYIIFIIIGTILTVIIQSSSATMALTITMCYSGWIPFHVAAAMVLGENIGTTITAQFAALIGNVHAKRTAWLHTLFNVIGILWMLAILPFVLQFIDTQIVQGYMEKPSAFIDSTSIPIALSLFHSFFNIGNTLLLIGFTTYLVKLVERFVPSSDEEDEKYSLEFFSSGLLSSSELSILESKKEIIKFGMLTQRMLAFTKDLLTNTDKKESDRLIDRISKYEEITDKIEIEIVNYLLKVAEGELAEETAAKVRSQLNIVRDLERIGDIFFQMSIGIERKKEEKIWFTPNQRNSLVELAEILDEAFEVMVANLKKSNLDETGFKEALIIEQQINKKRDEIREEHWKRIEKRDYDIKNGLIYNDLFSSLEKVGDQVINVSEALSGRI